MPSPEAFYLHLDGEQRGPYTVPQIDHLLHSGLIAQETLYWREGLDQWAPVTDLITLRKPKHPWRAILKWLVVLGLLAIPVIFFGPIVIDGWREANQHAFTSEAAYWRARGIVRATQLPAGTPVVFEDVEEAHIELTPPDTARVSLHGEVGGSPERTPWEVHLRYDAERAEWTGEAKP